MRGNVAGRFCQLLPAVVLLLSEARNIHAELKVTSNFENGSARVTGIDQAAQIIRFQPACNPARGLPNWWFLRVDGADPTRPVLFELRNQPGASFNVTTSNLVSAAVARRQDRFVALLCAEVPEMKINDDHPKPNDPADQKDWRVLTTSWLQERANPQTICFAIETPWNAPQGTVEGACERGRKLGRVMERYFRAPENSLKAMAWSRHFSL